MRTIRDQWAAATVNPKRPWSGTQEAEQTVELEPGRAVTLWSQRGAGMVDAFWLDVPSNPTRALHDLRLCVVWDEAPIPQVDAPAGLFFTVGYGRTISRGLLVGMAPPDGGYCYFPMPYRSAARIELRNAGSMSVRGLRFRVRWVPMSSDQISPMRFHATYRHEPAAGGGRLYVPLEATGRGHLVGLSAAMAHGDVQDTHFLEGDEYIHVDGEASASTAGTGTEDYFGCGWYFNCGPIALPTLGATEVGRAPLHRVAAYRLHVPDWVPFDRSLWFALEVGDGLRPETAHYATVAYYYLESP